MAKKHRRTWIAALAVASALSLAPLVACSPSAGQLTAKGPAADAGAPAAGETTAEGPATPSTAGALRVEGSRLVSETGEPVQLRGVSTHGLAWFPQYVSQPFFDELRQDWGANVVRLALYTAESGGYCTGGDQAQLKQLVRDGVDYAAKADLYAIVDWHVLADQDPNAFIDEALAFFAEMSLDLADRSNVIYEICNEPNGATSWEQVKAYAERIIPVIRANDPDAVIVVGTPTWSQRVDEAAADPLPDPNVMYSLHFYAATHQQDLRDKLEAAVAGCLPVFVTEFGICDASGNGAIDYASADAWVALMDRLGVSYVCWNLSNKDEASALFQPGCAKASGFDEADLSAEGRWLAGVLGAPGFDAGGAGSEGEGADDGAPAPIAAPSGELSGTSGSLAWTASVANSWTEGTSPCRQYALSIRNQGDAVSSWEVKVPIGAAFSLRDGWNGEYAAEGAVLRIANAGYNGAIPAGGEVRDIGFILRF